MKNIIKFRWSTDGNDQMVLNSSKWSHHLHITTKTEFLNGRHKCSPNFKCLSFGNSFEFIENFEMHQNLWRSAATPFETCCCHAWNALTLEDQGPLTPSMQQLNIKWIIFSVNVVIRVLFIYASVHLSCIFRITFCGFYSTELFFYYHHASFCYTGVFQQIIEMNNLTIVLIG